jgi:YfiH family protein
MEASITGLMPSPLEAENLKRLPGIRHGFFTRQGGVSEGIYASLNCGFGSSDDSELVAENRNRVARHLGGTYDGVVTLYQEHGTTAIEASGPVARGALPRADAVVSATPGLVIGVLAADCAPVLLADPEARVVAAAHAGWRGAVAGIIDSAIAEMERLGARRERISAAVGPCINQAAYEVGAEFEAQFLSRDPTSSRFFACRDEVSRPHFDLPGFVVQRLSDAGIGHVLGFSPCTHQNESLFFSYRRKTQRHEPDYGRQISAIVVA